MWEFSIGLKNDEIEAIKYVQNKLDELSKEFGCIVTKNEDNNDVSLVLACEEIDKSRISFFINDVITETICTYYKEKHLNDNLKLSNSDEVNDIALKKALLNFDKETDKYIVNKNILLSRNIYLPSFFRFKLGSLKEKWLELTKIANDNSGFFVSNDTFVELLKFLVDNLEITNDVVNIVENNGQYVFYDQNYNMIELQKNNAISVDGIMISNLINLCPKKIVLFLNSESSYVCDLIKQIFYKRVTILPQSAFQEQIKK